MNQTYRGRGRPQWAHSRSSRALKRAPLLDGAVVNGATGQKTGFPPIGDGHCTVGSPSQRRRIPRRRLARGGQLRNDAGRPAVCTRTSSTGWNLERRTRAEVGHGPIREGGAVGGEGPRDRVGLIGEPDRRRNRPRICSDYRNKSRAGLSWRNPEVPVVFRDEYLLQISIRLFIAFHLTPAQLRNKSTLHRPKSPFGATTRLRALCHDKLYSEFVQDPLDLCLFGTIRRSTGLRRIDKMSCAVRIERNESPVLPNDLKQEPKYGPGTFLGNKGCPQALRGGIVDNRQKVLHLIFRVIKPAVCASVQVNSIPVKGLSSSCSGVDPVISTSKQGPLLAGVPGPTVA